MNTKRILMLGAGGVAIAVWFAAASTSNAPRVAPVITTKPSVIDVSGAQLAAEIERLRDRLRPTDTPLQSRDLFRYGGGRAPSARRAAPAPAAPPVEEAQLPAPAAAQLKLVGIAEDVGDAGPVRTAIVSAFGDLFLVKQGEAVTPRYRVSAVSTEAVELVDTTDNTTVRLILK